MSSQVHPGSKSEKKADPHVHFSKGFSSAKTRPCVRSKLAAELAKMPQSRSSDAAFRSGVGDRIPVGDAKAKAAWKHPARRGVEDTQWKTSKFM